MRLLALLVVLLSPVEAALFAVDLGSEYIKVSLIKPGRVPISVVHNELSKRKTIAAVAFRENTRAYGEDALNLATKIPSRVFFRIRDYLGRNASDPILEKLQGMRSPYSFAADSDRLSIRFDIGANETLTSEEILVRAPYGYLDIGKDLSGEFVRVHQRDN